MAQIAQQDHLFIDLDITQGEASADAKKKLVECYKAGTFFDVIGKTTSGAAGNKLTSYVPLTRADCLQLADGSKKFTFEFGEISIEVDEGEA